MEQLLELADSGSFVQAIDSDTVVKSSVSLTTEPLVPKDQRSVSRSVLECFTYFLLCFTVY